jgi:hypothetical protein
MKQIKIIGVIAVSLLLYSCEQEDPTSLNYKLNKCKGTTTVTAIGVNEGNFEQYKHYILFKDSEGTVYEYIGAKYKVSVGDTLK